jgi:aminoglycoside phosphotransferase (APT) family kinase protein
VNTESLAAWLDEQDLPGRGEPLTLRRITGGAQNVIYEVRRGENLHAALRIPPPSAPANRDEGILREWRITKALQGSDVPHTKALAVCEDPSVLGRTFYLMGFVDGWSPMGTNGVWPEPFDQDLEQRSGLATELVDGLAKLARLDWQERGLTGLGRPEGFHERQVDRWSSMFERIRTRDLPGYEEVAAWLRKRRPLDYRPGIMHGDYQFANVMFEHGGPARMAAVVDWEMGTIGDPKLDLGWLLEGWPEDTNAGRGHITYVDVTGMPGRTAMLERYSEVSGRQVDDMDYYFVLARWKLGVVIEQGYQRAGDNPTLQAFGPVAVALMERAAELVATTDYSG